MFWSFSSHQNRPIGGWRFFSNLNLLDGAPLYAAVQRFGGYHEGLGRHRHLFAPLQDLDRVGYDLGSLEFCERKVVIKLSQQNSTNKSTSTENPELCFLLDLAQTLLYFRPKIPRPLKERNGLASSSELWWFCWTLSSWVSYLALSTSTKASTFALQRWFFRHKKENSVKPTCFFGFLSTFSLFD